ncbi:MAG: hypothetical protein ACP5IE_09360 [Infirmifilum sp.]
MRHRSKLLSTLYEATQRPTILVLTSHEDRAKLRAEIFGFAYKRGLALLVFSDELESNTSLQLSEEAIARAFRGILTEIDPLLEKIISHAKQENKATGLSEMYYTLTMEIPDKQRATVYKAVDYVLRNYRGLSKSGESMVNVISCPPDDITAALLLQAIHIEYYTRRPVLVLFDCPSQRFNANMISKVLVFPRSVLSIIFLE